MMNQGMFVLERMKCLFGFVGDFYLHWSVRQASDLDTEQFTNHEIQKTLLTFGYCHFNSIVHMRVAGLRRLEPDV